MSLTPIFDEVLAEHPGIWTISPIFPFPNQRRDFLEDFDSDAERKVQPHMKNNAPTHEWAKYFFARKGRKP